MTEPLRAHDDSSALDPPLPADAVDARPPVANEPLGLAPVALPVLPQVLVVDVGGTHLKVSCSPSPEVRKVVSGPTMTAEGMVHAVQALTADWAYGAVSIGYPGLVRQGRIVREPFNLGPGWTQLDFAAAFGKPVKLLNDAAMQALGSYTGGRMLFLGLGTGLGSALILNGVVQPLELAHLPYRKGRTYEDYAGVVGQRRLGRRRWRKAVIRMIVDLSAALEPEYVVVGGGEAGKLKNLPLNCRLGSNADASTGGLRMWTDAGLGI